MYEATADPLARRGLSISHFRAIHRQLFRDVYSWAGRFRTVRISKGGSTFCYPENIAAEIKRLFEWLRTNHFLRGLSSREFSVEAAHFLAELNAIHSLRDGNGRTQNIFLFLIAAKAGYALDFTRLDIEGLGEAVIRSFGGDEVPLARQIEILIGLR
jgi:cell filamentation protein